MSTVKVAVVQASSVILDKEKTMEKVSKITKEAASNGANLILFPEAFISCYPRRINVGAWPITAPTISSEHRNNFKRYWESAIEVPGPIVTQLENIARENKINVVIGVTEREGSTLYCCILYFNDEGKLLGKHRKIKPTAAERMLWGQGDGSTLPVFELSCGKVGALICWENYMPLARVAMYSKGIQIYCAPTADDGDGWIPSMQHIAQEGRCFVLGCNQFIRKSDYPEDLQATIDEDIVCRGGSCIVSPFGELLAGPNYTSEEILYATLDMDDVIKAKFEMDTVGHYSRPDIFSLTVNEHKTESVVRVSFPASDYCDHIVGKKSDENIQEI